MTSMYFCLILNDRTLYIYIFIITLTLLTHQPEKFLVLCLKTSLRVLRKMSSLLKAMGKQLVMVTCTRNGMWFQTPTYTLEIVWHEIWALPNSNLNFNSEATWNCSISNLSTKIWQALIWKVDLQVHWVPGHSDFAPNEKADDEVKKVAHGDLSDAKSLLKFLHKHLPLSISVLCQDHFSKLKKCWERRWQDSPRANLFEFIDNSSPSKKYIGLIARLDHRQVSILFQHCTGHISLNQHLFCIYKSKTPVCPNCQDLLVVELVKHFIL